MKIFIVSMPLMALTAILAAGATQRLEFLAQAEADGGALPETVAVWKQMQSARRAKLCLPCREVALRGCQTLQSAHAPA